LRLLLIREPQQAARVGRIEALTSHKLAELQSTIDARRNQGLNSAIHIVDSDSGRRAMDELRSVIGEIERAQAAEQASRRAELDYFRARIPVYLGGGSGIILVLLGCAFVVIRREANGRESAVEIAQHSRRKAESARDLLDLTLRSIGDAVITADASGRITMLNAAAQRLTGWGGEAIGRETHEVFRIINEYTRQIVESPIDKIRQTNAVVGLGNHTLLIRKDGAEVPIDDSGAPVRDEAGRIAGFVLVFRDVSERKVAEDALRRSEDRFRTLANAAPALLWLADRDGSASFFNRTWLEFTGRGEDAELGSGWGAGVHPDDLAQVQRNLQRGVESRAPFRFELRLRRADGEWRHMLWSTIPYHTPGGEHSGFVTACFDITDLKQAQEALQINEQRFRLLVSGTTLMVWHTDAAGGFASPQPQWEEFTGQKWPAYSGRGALDVIHPADRDALAKAWDRAIAARVSFVLSYRLWHEQTQNWRFVTTRATPLIGPEGEIREWIGILTDETERRKVEERLREAAKFESLAVLAGGIAHDFNNLLVGILGNASLLESSIENPDDRELAREVIRAGERAAALTQQMLAYSGRGRFVVQHADLSAEIEKLEPRLREIMPSSVRLAFDLARELPECEIDCTQIEQLVGNLVQNAAEAIPPSGGEVTVTTRTEVLPGGGAGFAFGDQVESGSYVVLEVSDTGQGMDGPTQSRIFDPFFSTRFTGRGLGLPVVLGIVRGHKGAIRVESISGRGSVFRIYLPASKIQRSECREERVGTPAIGDSRPAVLVVDDEIMVRSFVASALRRYGFQVLLAENGAQALDILRSRPDGIAAVLLDLTMPQMNGQETLANLRGIRSSLPVIASSGYSSTEALERFGGRIEAFIQKPYSPKHLAAVIRSVLVHPHELVPEKNIR
jgi:PAS domain S-box-containing protein